MAINCDFFVESINCHMMLKLELLKIRDETRRLHGRYQSTIIRIMYYIREHHLRLAQ